MPKRKDENELAKSLIDDIIAETESEDWNKEKPQKKSAALSNLNDKKIDKTKSKSSPYPS